VFALFRVLASDPAPAVGREPAAGDDTMQVRVMSELLSPAVEDGEEADLGAQVFGIGGDGAESGRYGLEQQVVDDGLVLQGQQVLDKSRGRNRRRSRR